MTDFIITSFVFILVVISLRYFLKRKVSLLIAKKPRILLTMMVAVLLIVAVGCTFTGAKLNDDATGMEDETSTSNPYFNVSAAYPAETVKDFLEVEKKQDYTLSLDIYEVAVSDSDSAEIIDRFKGSDYAKSKNWTDEYVEHNISAVAAYYSVQYDHDKIFYTDGEIVRRFYLKYDDATGLWSIWDNDGGIELDAFLNGNMKWPDCLTEPEGIGLGSVKLEYEASGTGKVAAFADIDRDGEQEIFYLDKSHMDSGRWVTLRVYDGEGNELWNEDAGISHVGWNSLFLCEQEGEYYLLRYHPTMYQGYCSYVYTLFTLEGCKEQVSRTNTLEFDINGTKALDAPEMVAFADEVNALLEKSTLLLRTEGGAYAFGPSSAFDFLERYSWLDGTPDLYTDGDNLQTRLEKFSEYAVSNRG